MARRAVLEVGQGALSDYYDWFKSAAHGDVLVYWTGHLQQDRQADVSNATSGQRIEISALNAVADRVLADVKRRDLLVTQKRLGEGRFEYRATRLRSPREIMQNRVVHSNDLVLA